MENLYDLHSWSKHYREEALQEARKRDLVQRATSEPRRVRRTLRGALASLRAATGKGDSPTVESVE